jgi:DNA-binding SARP family transcriptional activator/GAF domain-containing protein
MVERDERVGSEMEAILDRLLEACGADAAELFVREPGGDRLWLAAHRGIAARDFQQRTDFELGEGFPGLVAERGDAVMTVDLENDERYLRTRPKARGFRYYLCVPVVIGDLVVGSLHVASRNHRDAVVGRTELLTGAAESLAGLIELVRLRAKESVAGSPADPALDAKRNLERKLEDSLKAMIEGTGADGGIVLLRDSSSGALHPWCWQGAYESACTVLSRGATGVCACSAITQSRGKVTASRSEGGPESCRIAPSQFARVVCLPLVIGDETFGAVSLGYRDRQLLPGRLVTVLGSMAQRLALDVANAQAAVTVEERAIATRDLRLMGEFDVLVERSLRPALLRLGDLGNKSPDQARVELLDVEALMQESFREIATTRGSADQDDGHTAAAANTDLERALDLRCFGGLVVFRHGQRIDAAHFKRRRAWTLLKILLTNYGKTVDAEVLVDLLWPDGPPPGATTQLKVLVHDLRHTLEPDPTATGAGRFILWSDPGYAFNPKSPHRLDSREFTSLVRWGERLAQLGDIDSALVAYRSAAGLYTGDFLEEEHFSDWCAAERDYLRESFLTLLQHTATLLLARGDSDGATSYLRRALRVDAELEDVHRELMRILWTNGHHDDALRQYRACQAALSEHQNRVPGPDTERLSEQIRAAAPG